MMKDLSFAKKLPFTSSLLRGVGQIMLQENAWTGLLFIVAIFYSSPLMSAGAFIAVLSGTTTAKLLKYGESEIHQGLYGFSAALVGVALLLFYKPSLLVWIVLIIASALATIVQNFFIVKQIPVFTLPFVLVTWIVMFLFNRVLMIEPSALLNEPSVIVNNYLFTFHGYGQVIFQSSLYVGIIFLIAVFINSPLAALYGFAGAVIAGAFSVFLPVSAESIALGLWSYNAVLCAIVFTGKRFADILWMTVSAFLSVVIYFGMYKLSFTPLTFPFVAATILTMEIKKITEKRSRRVLEF